jgi:hypothetical protein
VGASWAEEGRALPLGSLIPWKVLDPTDPPCLTLARHTRHPSLGFFVLQSAAAAPSSIAKTSGKLEQPLGRRVCQALEVL